jgi:hypothetical protein
MGPLLCKLLMCAIFCTLLIHCPLYLHALQVGNGEVSLTRCTLRKCAASPPGYMAAERWGAVLLAGPAAVTLQHCYVEVGMMCVEAS